MKKMHILYEDKNLLIIDKPAKQLTIATEKNKTSSLYYEASQYVKKQYPKNKIFIVNRLDRDTSGLVVFAKNEELKTYLQNNWDKVALRRKYMAVVEKDVKDKGKTLQYYLQEDKFLNVHVTRKEEGKLAITKFETIYHKRAYSLLDIEIFTGRKHQIRVSLKEYGHPIIGDKKYNAKSNPLGRLGLHAYHLTLKVPYQKDPLVIECKVPKEFMKMFESEEENGKITESHRQ